MEKLEKLIKLTKEDLTKVKGGMDGGGTSTSFSTNDCTDVGSPDGYDYCSDSDVDYGQKKRKAGN